MSRHLSLIIIIARGRNSFISKFNSIGKVSILDNMDFSYHKGRTFWKSHGLENMLMCAGKTNFPANKPVNTSTKFCEKLN